ncbi:MAG: GMC family oxidoreductase [Desulfobacterales bacterium]|nr:GMC family oxidoreductase [Desulfobacteraceae bacterium]MBT7085160.1 GMC family oxidoreductase [Desulfobacterales bacterium]
MEVFQKEYDAVVVGSGPGGATVAKELSQNGKKVLILEWGSNASIKGTFLQTAKMIGIPGKSLLVTNKKLHILLRGITTGGSSVFYCGAAFDPPFDMLMSYGIDIKNEIKELKNEIPVKPLSNELMGPMADKIFTSAQDLGYNWEKINKFLFQDKCKADCWRCSYGCPYDAMWNARNFVDEAVKNGATLVNDAKVKTILTNNNKATGIVLKKRGRTHRVEAPVVVLSAGGIGSAEILRRSGVEKAGYDFFVDPLIIATGRVKGLRKGKELHMQAGIHVKDEYVLTDMAAPKANRLSIMVKIKDDLGGRITDRGGCRKDLCKSDYKKLDDGYGHARKILGNAGVKNVRKSMVLAGHPGGTVKIGDIVDSDLKTVYDNLYVCDCSVIPKSWGLPPTLTLLGLGKRLSKHLLNN